MVETPAEENGQPVDDPTAIVGALPVWARFLAFVIGLAAAGAGGLAVFVSDNQAGTAALVLLSLIMLVLGLQGTPISRVVGGGSSVELAVFRDRLRRASEESAQQDPPDVAVRVQEAIASVDPSAVAFSGNWRTYEAAVLAAVTRLMPDIEVVYPLSPDSGIDARLVAASRTLNLEVKYRRRPLGVSEFRALDAQAAAFGREGRLLIVTNASLSRQLLEDMASDLTTTTEIVRWTGPSDDLELKAAIARNLR